MMSTILENNWGEAILNSSVSEQPPLQFPEKMRSMYGTPLLFAPGHHEKGNSTLMAFANATMKHFDLGDAAGDGFGMGIDNESNGQISANFEDESSEYIFDRTDVRAIFLVLYTIVFASCFFGNLMVILVVTLHWRMRSITNFCLANLAFADGCVGIFCVYQNIWNYIMNSWIFGEFACKMYAFINSLSTTASVLILVVICIERYLAIIHPMRCKQMLTLNRLRITIVCVWILSAAISAPRFYYFHTLSMPLPNGQNEILCLPNRRKYDSKLMDMISMTVLFLIPLAIISVLYTQIGIVLWKTSNTKMPAATPSCESSSSSGYYREATDNNLVQPVNLTLPLVSDQQNRPNTLHGVPANSTQSPSMKKRSASSSFIPFVCLKCLNKSAKQGKGTSTKKQFHNHTCRTLNGGLPSTVTSGGTRACNGNGVAGSTECADYSLTCKACQYPFNHHHSGITGHLTAYEPSENMTTSFINGQHNGRVDNVCTNGDICARDEATSSPVAVTCCGGVKRGKCLGLGKHGSLDDKAITFSENVPPSPYCTKSCACLDGKESSTTDPIVLVKFEKKRASDGRGRRKGNGKRSQCTILMMNTKKLQKNDSGKCNGNGRISIDTNGDTDECTDSPASMSPSPPRLDCAICHPPGFPTLHIECGDGGNVNGNHVVENGHGMHNCCQKNFSFEHKRNLSVDSGISGMPQAPNSSQGRSVMEGGACDQNFDIYSMGTCTVSCPSCGANCGESYQLSKCHQRHYPTLPPSPKLPLGTTCFPGTTTQPAPKRLRRMRVVRSSKYGSGALQSRRRIIRMLIVVVLAFALCHLPLHARKVWQYWNPKWAKYHGGSVFSALFTPITFLIMYANSGINPILYAFMSKKFRMSFKDLLLCKMRHSLRISRNASVRSTHAVALSQAGL